MDSLTQIVLGAAVGEASLGKKVGNKALLWGAIAGTIPDLDVFTKLFTDNIVTANEIHRGFSHSILFCLLTAPIFGWLLSKLYKKQEATWKDWSLLMFWGLFTHPILDAFTTWGTQLFWPLNYKVSFKNIFVVDPLYTLPFLICVIAVLFYKRNNPKRKKINLIGIYISSTYMIIGSYSLFDKDKKINFIEFKKNHHLLNNLKNEPLVKRLIKLTENWYTLQIIEDKLFLNDLRFGLRGSEKHSKTFVFRYELTHNKDGKIIALQSDPNPKEAAPLLKELWLRILGNK